MATQDTGKHENDIQIRLIGLSGAYKGNEYFLRKDEFVIGRSPECDLVVNENTVSGRHAKITKVGDHYEIFDLNSTNGTFVNGVKIDKKPLRSEDKIKFDVFEFQYIHPEEVARTIVTEAPTFKEPQKTMVRPEADLPVAPAQATAPPPQQEAPAEPQAHPPEMMERERAQPRIQTADFEKHGSLVAGLIVGLIIAFLVSYGGLFLSNLIQYNFQVPDIVMTLRTVASELPIFHIHTPWMNAVWNLEMIIVAVSIPLALLLGGLITQSIGVKNRFGTAILFSIFYVLIAGVLLFAAFDFNFDIVKTYFLAANIGITDPLINMIATLGYFFGVTFVISFIGTLLGRK